jgi:hypothetical protein
VLTMARRHLASPSLDGIDADHWPHLEQRQRESSVGNFNLQYESPVIVQMNADYLRCKLAQIDTLPRKWMTQDELYYMAKAPDLWPWQRTDVLTPTPPDTPNSMREASSLDTFDEGSSWIRNCKEPRTSLQQNTLPSKPIPSGHDLRNRQSGKKRTKDGIRKKQTRKWKHTMVTRSRCRGRCCREQVAG